MIPSLLVALIFVLATILPAYLEAGALIGLMRRPPRSDLTTPEPSQPSGVLSVVAATVAARVWIISAGSRWIFEEFERSDVLSQLPLTLMVPFAYVGAEILGKALAVSRPETARRAAQPFVDHFRVRLRGRV